MDYKKNNNKKKTVKDSYLSSSNPEVEVEIVEEVNNIYNVRR